MALGWNEATNRGARSSILFGYNATIQFQPGKHGSILEIV